MSSLSPQRVTGHSVGAIQAGSVGNGAWTDRTGANFNPVGGLFTPAATHEFSALWIKNTHATQTLYLLLKAAGGEATSAAIRLEAGTQPMSFDLYGKGITTISLQGSGAATTFDAVAEFVGEG